MQLGIPLLTSPSFHWSILCKRRVFVLLFKFVYLNMRDLPVLPGHILPLHMYVWLDRRYHTGSYNGWTEVYLYCCLLWQNSRFVLKHIPSITFINLDCPHSGIARNKFMLETKLVVLHRSFKLNFMQGLVVWASQIPRGSKANTGEGFRGRSPIPKTTLAYW